MYEFRVLMVCMGNICRSPMAEAVLRHHLRTAGLDERVLVDSAGTHAYHVGEPPHRGTLQELGRRGVEVGTQVSRTMTSSDLQEFDLVLAMDYDNLAGIEALAAEAGGLDHVRAQVSLLLDHVEDVPGAVRTREVPDPFYVGGFDHVYDLVDAGCVAVLDRVRDSVTP